MDLSQNIEADTKYLMPNLMWQSVTDPSDELLKRLRVTYRNADKVQYDQWDSPFGVLPYRGLDAEPPMQQFPGFKKFTLDPGYWGAKTRIGEKELTQGRQPGTLGDPISVGDLTTVNSMHFNTQIVSLMRKAMADTVRTGGFGASGATGTPFNYKIKNYSSQQFSPATQWHSSASTATPITDQLGWKATLQMGSSNKFGKTSVLLGNSNSIAELFATNQIQATYRGPYGSSIIGLDGTADVTGLNKIQQGFDLPTIIPYDFGYYATLADSVAGNKAAWNYIIPNRCLLWLGERDGENQIVGEFQMTRHAGKNEEGGAADYPNADDLIEGLDAFAEGLYVRLHYHNSQPHGYVQEVGVNGSPLLGYPGAVAVITWS